MKANPRALPVLALTAALVAAPACSRDPTTPTGLQVVPSKPTYAPGEQVSLTVTLTNRGTKPCKMSGGLEGVLTVKSMTLDGKPVTPRLSGGSYMVGVTYMVYSNLVAVASSGSVSVPWKSMPSSPGRRASLETSSLGQLNSANLAFWPIDEPGRYELTVGYLVPPLPDEPADLCRIADSATFGFVVTGGQ